MRRLPATRRGVLASIASGGALAIGGASALAQPFDPPGAGGKRAAVLERLFRQAPALADWFAPAFLAQVPAARVAELVAGLERRHGPYREVVETNGSLAVRLLRADIPVQVALDAQGRIAGLLFHPAVPAFGTLAPPRSLQPPEHSPDLRQACDHKNPYAQLHDQPR